MHLLTRSICAILALIGILATDCLSARAAEQVMLTTADGVAVFGEVWRAKPGAPWILAFHQAGSSRAEYEPLAPLFVAAGFSVLAIDQRSGGDLFGVNKTVEKLGASGSYEAAMADLEAALAWGKSAAGGAPVIVMGSSYSAALVFLLAAQNPDDVDGVVSFSPGEYLTDRQAVHKAAGKIAVPVYVTEGAGEENDVGSIYDALPQISKMHHMPGRYGVHGASTLRVDKNPQGARENMNRVLAFMQANFPPR